MSLKNTTILILCCFVCVVICECVVSYRLRAIEKAFTDLSRELSSHRYGGHVMFYNSDGKEKSKIMIYVPPAWTNWLATITTNQLTTESNKP